MANESKQDRPEQKAGSGVRRASRRDEFDDAVTTELGDDPESFFYKQQAEVPSDLFVTDVSLSEHVEIEADDVLPAGILLKNRFEIVELVYAAGMSFVYRAIDRHPASDDAGAKSVAIKTMRPSIGSGNHGGSALEREAAIARKLSHPNIIDIFDFDDEDGQSFLVMEWLEGESVNALLRRTGNGLVDPELARTLITLTAAGLRHAHQRNVVHADINPSNIFITETGEVKLLDFGVARYVNAPEQSEDDRFTWVTQTYASPEVLSGLPPVVEDDVFSLACIAYRLLSGRHPFGGSPSLVARNNNLSPEVISGLPDEDWDVLRRALSFERSERPSNVNDFVTWRAMVAENEEPAVRWGPDFIAAQWRWLAAAAAVAVLVGAWWMTQRVTDDEIAEPSATALSDEGAIVEPEMSASQALVVAATQALNDGKLIEPPDVNARALFRAALVLEPGSPEALSGMRAISDIYLQEAQAALNRDSLDEAYAAISIATETDPANPSIGIVDQLLVVKGNAELAEARLAVTTGDVDAALQNMSRAEQYRHIDAREVQALREELDGRRIEGVLLDQLATVDAHIAADRLQLPEGNNAYALLLELNTQFGDDTRVLASKERLGERLLARAQFAIEETELQLANDLIDAVDDLGVLTSEAEALRLSVTAADNVVETPDAPPAAPETDTQTADAQLVDEQPVATTQVEELESAPIVNEDLNDASTQVAASRPAVPEEIVPEEIFSEETVPEDIVSEATVPEETVVQETVQQAPPQTAPEIPRLSLQELGIREYVAPTFPRAARRRNLSGLVEASFIINAAGNTESIEIVHSEPGDTFSQSAVRAIAKWRFEAREEPFPAYITLRFEQE